MFVSQDEDLGRLAQDMEAKTVLFWWPKSVSVVFIEKWFFARVSNWRFSFEVIVFGRIMVDGSWLLLEARTGSEASKLLVPISTSMAGLRSLSNAQAILAA